MKKHIGLWQLFGFAVTSLLGTVLHFLYELSGSSVWIAPFSGVNESTFEHMKLLFWPMLLFALIQGIFFREREDFFSIKLRAVLLGLTLIPVLFYTYNGVIGKSPDWINIAIFFISALAAYIYEAKKLKGEPASGSHPCIAIVILALIGVLFAVFTFYTPEIGIFKDPLTGSFGI
jgi:hypothetical protein